MVLFFEVFHFFMNSATSVFVRPLICLSLNSTPSRTFFFVFTSSSTSLIILFTSAFIWLYSSAVLKGLPARPLKPVIRLLVYCEILLRSFLRFSAVLTLLTAFLKRLRGFTLVVVTVVRALLTASFRCLAFTPAFLIVSTTPTFLAAFLKRLRGFTLVVVTVVRALLTASFRCLAFTPAFLIVSTTPTFLAAFLKRLRGLTFALLGTFTLLGALAARLFSRFSSAFLFLVLYWSGSIYTSFRVLGTVV